MRSHFALGACAISALLVVGSAAQAMEIQQFDKMSTDDQAEYVADLIQGTERVLNEANQRDSATKLHHLYADIAAGDSASLGMAELTVNLAAVRAAETTRQARDSKLRHLTVEDAFSAVAQDHGIPLPSGYVTVNANFHPKQPQKR